MAARHATLRGQPTHLQPATTAEAKAKVAEAVLGGGDLAECAQAALRWLGTHAGVDRALCAVVDEDQRRLAGLVGDGVPHAKVTEFAIELGADDPLLIALGGAEPVLFRPGRRARHPATPLGDIAFHAVPLVPPEAPGGTAIGLLLLAGIDGPIGAEVEWAAKLLAVRLVCTRFRGADSAKQRSDRERSMLHRVINAVTDPILLSDAEGSMLIANKHAEQLFAASENVSEGRRRAIALNNMLFSATLFTATEYGDPTRRELLLVDPIEGRDLLFELLSTPIQDGADSGVVSVLRNVNDLRRATEEIEAQYRKLRAAEAETRAERDRLDLIINAVVDPVLVTDPSGNIVMMNPPAERLFAGDLAPTSPATKRHVRANDAVFSSFVSNLYTHQALRWRGELNLVDPATGDKLSFEAIAGKVIAKHGEDTAVVTILHDRSEAIENARLYAEVKRYSEEQRKMVQDATAELTRQNELLKRQAIALEQASEAKSSFIANISHELRTPLNAVLGYTDLLRKGVFGELQPRQLEKLERVDSNSKHLLTIINELLDIARIESGTMPVHIETFEVSAVLHEVMRELEPIIARSRPSVTCEAEPGIPPARTDRQKVKRVVLNLLSNALKFTPEGFVQVRGAYEQADDTIVITVADTGIGIKEHEQELIFDHFYQAKDTASRQQGGTGLGLAICRRLAAILGGRLTLVSKPGAGSTFSLHFPRERRSE